MLRWRKFSSTSLTSAKGELENVLTEQLSRNTVDQNRLLEECVDLVARGAVEPIRPIRAFDATEIEQAFRCIQAGQHKGKIVVRMSEDLAPYSKMPLSISFSPSHAYLLVGGLGGIGRAVSQ